MSRSWHQKSNCRHLAVSRRTRRMRSGLQSGRQAKVASVCYSAPMFERQTDRPWETNAGERCFWRSKPQRPGEDRPGELLLPRRQAGFRSDARAEGSPTRREWFFYGELPGALAQFESLNCRSRVRPPQVQRLFSRYLSTPTDRSRVEPTPRLG
jgi:hypothetical protein